MLMFSLATYQLHRNCTNFVMDIKFGEGGLPSRGYGIEDDFVISESLVSPCFFFYPLLPNVTQMVRIANILILIQEGIIKKISYERRDYI